MSRSSLQPTPRVVTVLTPIATAGLLAVVGPASAIPFEGDPGASQCLRLERLPGRRPAGSLFVRTGTCSCSAPTADRHGRHRHAGGLRLPCPGQGRASLRRAARR